MKNYPQDIEYTLDLNKKVDELNNERLNYTKFLNENKDFSRIMTKINVPHIYTTFTYDKVGGKEGYHYEIHFKHVGDSVDKISGSDIGPTNTDTRKASKGKYSNFPIKEFNYIYMIHKINEILDKLVDFEKYQDYLNKIDYLIYNFKAEKTNNDYSDLGSEKIFKNFTLIQEPPERNATNTRANGAHLRHPSKPRVPASQRRPLRPAGGGPPERRQSQTSTAAATKSDPSIDLYKTTLLNEIISFLFIKKTVHTNRFPKIRGNYKKLKSKIKIYKLNRDIN